MADRYYPDRRHQAEIGHWPRAVVLHAANHYRTDIHYALETAGFSVRTASSVDVAHAELDSCDPDLLIVQLGFPYPPALDLLRGRPSEWQQSRVILALAAGEDAVDRAVGDALGVRLWLQDQTPPEAVMTALRELIYGTPSVACHVPRYMPRRWTPFMAGPLLVSILGRYVESRGRRQKLSFTELRLLLFLVENAQRCCPEDELLSSVWALDRSGPTRRVHAVVKRLRDFFRNEGRLIDFVSGEGFRLGRRFLNII